MKGYREPYPLGYDPYDHVPEPALGDYTRHTNRELCASRPTVTELPPDIKAPSLDEGVPFVQKMAREYDY